MAINIKELFVTDQDPIGGSWWYKDKVDKINYNFVQLSEGGTPGPQGPIGADGGFGPIGAQGPTGYKGSQGYQGFQGAAVVNEWDYFPEADGLPGYLYPGKNPINIPQSAPVALRIGYQGADLEYNVGADPIDTQIQIVKTLDNSWVNLRVEDNNNFYGYNFNFKSSSDSTGGSPRFEISTGIFDDKFKIIYTAQTIVLRTDDSSNTLNLLTDSIIITNSLITINGTNFNLGNSNGITKAQSTFTFASGADTDKVLVATNTAGNVVWKDVKDVFGTFPIGSIVSIRPNEFNTVNFWLNDSINVSTSSLLNNIYGRGKVGTDYEGWYLCNGETWEADGGFNQYLTPNLNNFSYTIGANGSAQNLTTVPEAEPILIGGYDMRILASTDVNGLYNVEYTNQFLDNNTSPGTSVISMGTSGSFQTSRMIHIVYLGFLDLKWSNNGTYVPPVTSGSSILLTAPGPDLAPMCLLPVTTNYNWTGPDSASWNTFTLPSTYKLFNAGTTVYAPTGWYVNIDGYPIRWRSETGQFTSRGAACVTTPTNAYNFKTSLLVDDLNGVQDTLTGNVLLVYNASLFINATTLTFSDDQTLYPIGSNALVGWYRELTTGVRRYWSGSSFVGVSFTEWYVSRLTVDNAGSIDPGYNNASAIGLIHQGDSVCDFLQEPRLTYVAGYNPFVWSYNNTDASLNVITFTEYVKAYDSALYVTRNWVSPTISFIDSGDYNTPPLVNIKDQTTPSSNSLKYSKAYMTSGTNIEYSYATLSTSGLSPTGKITNVIDC